MRKLCFMFAVLFLSLPHYAHAEATVVEGEAAKKLYATDKGKVQTLVQKDKEFVLRAPDGTETPKPEKVTVKVGERFYITNEEMEFVHNVYDSTDSSWLLKKQEASAVAAITFFNAGHHKTALRHSPYYENRGSGGSVAGCFDARLKPLPEIAIIV